MAHTGQLVEMLIAGGKLRELVALLTGEVDASRFIIHPQRVADRILLAHAVGHLSYLRDFPKQSGLVEKVGKVYSDYPDEFQRWLASGTPGLTDAALEAAGLHPASLIDEAASRIKDQEVVEGLTQSGIALERWFTIDSLAVICYMDDSDQMMAKIIEDEALAQATVAFLRKRGQVRPAVSRAAAG